MNSVKQSTVRETNQTHTASAKHVPAKQHKGKKHADSISFAGALINAASPAGIHQDLLKPALHKSAATSSASHVKGSEIAPLHADARAVRADLQQTKESTQHFSALSQDKNQHPDGTARLSLPVIPEQKNPASSASGLSTLTAGTKSPIGTALQADATPAQTDPSKSKPNARHAETRNRTLAVQSSPTTKSQSASQQTSIAGTHVSTETVHNAKREDTHAHTGGQVQASVSPYSTQHSVNAGNVQNPAHTNAQQVLNLRSPTAYSQFSQVVVQQLAQHQSRVSVQVEPEGLGPIVVHVQEKAGQLNIHVQATQLQTMQWFHAERQNLLSHLADSGHNVQSMEISFTNSFSDPGQGGTPQSRYSPAQNGGLGHAVSQSGDRVVHGSPTVGQDVRRWYV